MVKFTGMTDIFHDPFEDEDTRKVKARERAFRRGELSKEIPGLAAYLKPYGIDLEKEEAENKSQHSLLKLPKMGRSAHSDTDSGSD